MDLPWTFNLITKSDLNTVMLLLTLMHDYTIWLGLYSIASAVLRCTVQYSTREKRHTELPCSRLAMRDY